MVSGLRTPIIGKLCPTLSESLFSAGCAWEAGIGFHVLVQKGEPHIELKERKVPLRPKDRLFMMKCIIIPKQNEKEKSSKLSNIWHRRLGHPNQQRMACIDCPEIQVSSDEFCEVCVKGKMTKKNYDRQRKEQLI